MYYNECRMCGATLDPGEKCSDCMDRHKKVQQAKKQIENSVQLGRYGQFQFAFGK